MPVPVEVLVGEAVLEPPVLEPLIGLPHVAHQDLHRSNVFCARQVDRSDFSTAGGGKRGRKQARNGEEGRRVKDKVAHLVRHVDPLELDVAGVAVAAVALLADVRVVLQETKITGLLLLLLLLLR